MAHIERRELPRRDRSDRVKTVVRYKVRYHWSGPEHSETNRRMVDAERRKAEIETELTGGVWRDPRRVEIRLSEWAADWVQTRA